MKDRKRIPIIFPTGSMMNGMEEPFVIDPMGSYTGVPSDLDETPVQDADDL